MKTHSNSFRAGWTRADLLVAIIFVAVVLGGLLLPALAQAKKKSSRLNCPSNLKQIGTAFRLWAGDNGDKYPMEVSVTNGGTREMVPGGLAFLHFQVMSNELNTPRILHCGADTPRTSAFDFATNFNNSCLSYFVGIDANGTNPASILCGDRNLTVGGAAPRRGLALVAPGSVLGWTSSIHKNTGNVLLGDGSVQQFTTAQLQQYWRDNGTTNRLAIP